MDTNDFVYQIVKNVNGDYIWIKVRRKHGGSL
jgi:hypothetical protein